MLYAKHLPAGEREAVAAFVGAFYGYQQTWLLDRETFSALVKARQIGASHTYAAAAVLWGLVGEPTAIISIGEREASEVLNKCERHCNVLVRLGSEWARVISRNATTLRMASGATITSLPQTSGARGLSCNVLLDEVAYMQHADEVWDAAGSATSHGFKLRVMSTPNGAGNLFHSIIAGEPGKFFRQHSVTIDQARADGLQISEDRLQAQAKGDPRLYDQLYRCRFLDNQDQYIPSPLIEACSVGSIYVPEGPTYAGLDVGRKADLTALAIVRLDRFGVRHLVHLETRKRTEFEDLERLVSLALGPTYRATRVCIDETGIGQFPAAQLQKRHGRSRIEPVSFTLQSKEDLATTLYQHFADARIRIPKGNTDLRDDLCSLRRIVTTAGNVRYDAPHTDKGHADRAWALALALHGCSGPDRTKNELAI